MMDAPQQPLQAPPEAGSMTAARQELLARTPDVIAPAGLKRLRAVKVERLPVVRGRPPRLATGMSSAKRVHFASVRSVG